MAWSKDNGSGSGKAAYDYVEGKKPLIERAITDTAAALPLATAAKSESAAAKISAGQAEVKSANALGKAMVAMDVAEMVRDEFDRVIAEAGSNNPEVVQARGEYVNLRARLDDYIGDIDGGLFSDATTGIDIDGGVWV